MSHKPVFTEVDVRRLRTIRRTFDGASAESAASALKLGTRQVFRLKAKVRTDGDAGIIHGNRGRRPANALSECLREYLLNHRRNVDNDNTVRLHGVRYQLLPSRHTARLAATDVDVQEWFDGSVHIFHPRAGEVSNRSLGRYSANRHRPESISYDISALQEV